MATNAELVEQARKMGLTGYDKKTASVTGPGAGGPAVKRGEKAADAAAVERAANTSPAQQAETGIKRTRADGTFYDAAGNYTGPVNDFGLAQGGAGGGSSGASGSRSGRSTSGAGEAYSYLDAEPLRENVRRAMNAALQQQQAQTDEATRQAVRKLQNTQRQAQAGFQTQRDAVALDEAQALDKSALYAELRGDRGGIGRAQYDRIQNTAAKNRQSIRQAQAQLEADTSRQIAELCAQGEYEKANAVLQAAQQQLEQLQAIEKQAVDYNLNVDKLNHALAQQEREWIAEQERTAVEDARYADETAYKRQKDALSQAGKLAEAMLKSGMPLTDAQREALGITEEQEAALANLYAAQAAEKTVRRSGNGGGGGGNTASSDEADALFSDAVAWAAQYDGDPLDFVKCHYKQYGFTNQSAAEAGLSMYLTEQEYAAQPVVQQPLTTGQQRAIEAAAAKALKTEEFWDDLASGMKTDWEKYGSRGENAADRLAHMRKDYFSALALARAHAATDIAKPYLDELAREFGVR